MTKRSSKPDPLKGSPKWNAKTVDEWMAELRGNAQFERSVSRETFAMWCAFYDWVKGTEFDPTDEVALREIAKTWRDREGHPQHAPRTMRSAMRHAFGEAVLASRTKSKRITGAPTDPKALMKFMIRKAEQECAKWQGEIDAAKNKITAKKKEIAKLRAALRGM